ncbi:hypothetical protein ACLQ28_31495 [Micromonospora sp. DT201]|uniref:hypothetical protein n=1 Tax=Micromonospora sp. DT201 TaxID=3393442 RepID=UPI003CE806DE
MERVKGVLVFDFLQAQHVGVQGGDASGDPRPGFRVLTLHESAAEGAQNPAHVGAVSQDHLDH